MINLTDVLLNPLDGYTRFDDLNDNIEYIGSGWVRYEGTNYNVYNGGHTYTYTAGEKIKFNFTGSTLIMRMYSNSDTSGFNIKVDGEDLGNHKTAYNIVSSTVCYIKEDFGNTEHFVEITCLDSSNFDASSTTRITLDSIDLKEGEILKPYEEYYIYGLLDLNNDLYTYRNNRFIQTSDYQIDGMIDLSPILTPDNLIKYDMNYNTDDNGGKIFKKEIDKNLLKSIKKGEFSFNL